MAASTFSPEAGGSGLSEAAEGRRRVQASGGSEPKTLAELCALDPDRDGAAVPDAAIQDLMALAIRLYAARAGGRGDPSEPALAPYRPESGVTATQVAIAAERLLAAADIDIFELQMWRLLGAR